MRVGLPRGPFLYPLLDVDTVGEEGVVRAAGALAKAGVGVLQLRAKSLPDRRLVPLAHRVLRAAHDGGALLLVNDRPDVARLVGADGVHVGQDDLAAEDARAVVGDEKLLGVSTHDLEQLRAAAQQPVDYIALGPVYETDSKAKPDPVVGPQMFEKARPLTSHPLVAIGGITRANAREVVRCGADGVAVIADLFRGADPAAVAREFDAVLRG